MTPTLASITLTRAEDVFALRHCGRSAAAAIGLEEADQVRLATALSELGREALTGSSSARAAFGIHDDALIIEIDGLAGSSPALATAIAAARRLIADLTVTESQSGGSTTVRLVKYPPRGFRPDSQVVEQAIRSTMASGPLEDLRVQNQDLISTLDEIRAGQEALIRVNAELEETNRGVLAMYSQLSDELEETNRGVVALYAELDDKSRQLKDVSDSKSRFLTSISHELRSPVNSIVGLVRLLEEDLGPASDEGRRELRYIHEAATRLLQLVDELLNLARAESGRLQPDISKVAIADILAELRGSIRPLLAPSVELVIPAPAFEFVYCDHALLVQILRNLLSNAAKFTEFGQVEMTTAAGPEDVTITVSDTGIGIDADDQSRIFEDFYQVRGPLQARHKGTGLGLGYSRRVARALGGDIDVSSSPGVGTSFVVTLPNRLSRETNLPSPDDVARATALVVDDDPGFRFTMRALLDGVVHRVIEAGGGREALDLMQAHLPDLVFLDLSMPDMSGDQVLEAMTSLGLGPIPVIVVTSADPPLGSLARLGVVSWLRKATLDRDAIRTAVGLARIEPETE